MQKIESFQIDHNRLEPGIYLSRKDWVGKEEICTYDIRLKRPNREAPLTSEVAHTIEHIAATFLRHQSPLRENTIYFGPMGCLTGFYLILNKQLSTLDLVPHITELFRCLARFDEEIPGASPKECGNYQLMDLHGAREEAERYYQEILSSITKENLEYPSS